MFKKTRLKIKNYFLELFSPEKRERGIAIVDDLIIVALLAGGAVAAWTWLTGDDKVAIAFATVIGSAFMGGAEALLYYATNFLSYVLSPTFTNGISDIAKDTAFVQAWASVRDLTNMLIVLAFVAVGIATTLRIKDYEAKNLLFKLIILALFINFSGLLCGTIIKAADITQTALLSSASASGNLGALGKTLADYCNGVITNSPGLAGQWAKILGTSIGLGIIMLFASWIFLILGILLAARYAVLAVLYILSPLAFFSFVFPAAKGIWNKWLHEFLNWSFLGVTSAFFIYLGMTVLFRSGASVSLNNMFVSFIFLYVGYKMARKTSAEGAGAIIGLAGAAATMAIGGATKIAGGAAGLAGKGALGLGGAALNSRPAQAISNATGRAMEALHLRSEGTTANRTAKQREEVAKNVGNLSESRKTQLAKGEASMSWTREGADKREAAIRDKIKNNKLGDIGDIEAQHQALSWVEAREKGRGGVSTIRKDAEKSNVLLRSRSPEALADYKKRNSGATDDQARYGVIREGIEKMDKGAFVKSMNENPDNFTKEVMAAAPIEYMRHFKLKGSKNLYKRAKLMGQSRNTRLGIPESREHMEIRTLESSLRSRGLTAEADRLRDNAIEARSW